jgi:hypothetical protein
MIQAPPHRAPTPADTLLAQRYDLDPRTIAAARELGVLGRLVDVAARRRGEVLGRAPGDEERRAA